MDLPRALQNLILDGLVYGMRLWEYMAKNMALLLPLLCAVTAAQVWTHWLLRRRRVRAGVAVSVLVPLALLFAYLELELAHTRDVWEWNSLLAGAGVMGILLGAAIALLLRLDRESRGRARSEADGGGPPL